ncbi:unnamed protein product [Amoebophrya sp. A120]|nr:unnamed protein product [Amoebophrya sp. A120]|eukprot:GSA120T00003496001.1
MGALNKGGDHDADGGSVCVLRFPSEVAGSREAVLQKLGLSESCWTTPISVVEDRIAAALKTSTADSPQKLDLSHVDLSDRKLEIAVENNKREFEAQVRKYAAAQELRKKAGKEKDFATATSKRKKAKEMETEADERKVELRTEMEEHIENMQRLGWQKLIYTWENRKEADGTAGASSSPSSAAAKRDGTASESAGSGAAATTSETDDILIEEIEPEARATSGSTTASAMAALQRAAAPGDTSRVWADKEKEQIEPSESEPPGALSQAAGFQVTSGQTLQLRDVRILNFRNCNLGGTALDALFAAILQQEIPLHAICLDANPIQDDGSRVLAQMLCHTSEPHTNNAKAEKAKRVTQLGRKHARKMDAATAICPTLESVSAQAIQITDAGFSTLVAAIAKAGPNLHLLDVRNNSGVEMGSNDRDIALRGMKTFNKTCAVLH